ncbi:MAG: hypothetical protein JXA49_03495 [Actinobacteria bacterium]|nr:hypothetical protein [Actinomycetota bacterium]
MEVIKRYASIFKIFFTSVLITLITATTFSFHPAAGAKEETVNYGNTIPCTITGSGPADRKLLGLCTHDPGEITAGKIPASEWRNIRNIRLNIPWGAIEKARGELDWSYSDKAINQSLKVGVNSIMITLGQPIPQWAVKAGDIGNPQMGAPEDNRDFQNFCEAFARRYRGYVDYYQIYQEPGWDLDAPPSDFNIVYFNGYCDKDYLGILRAGYNGIKAGNPDAYVISGSMENNFTKTAVDFINYEALLEGVEQDVEPEVDTDEDVDVDGNTGSNKTYPGGDVELGVKTPGKTWFLAEGATHPGFEQWICIQNPGDASATVKITYMFSDGETENQEVFTAAHSRATVYVNGAIGAGKDVSAKITSNRHVIVERPMYFNYKGKWEGGSVESGVAELSKTWYFAEGATHPGFEQWISIMNPGDTAAEVTLTYMFDGGETRVQNLDMSAASRETVMVNDIVGPNRNVSTKIESTEPIIAERPMYFNYHDSWPGGHTQAGTTSARRSWFLAEGTTRNNSTDGIFEEWVSIQNPGDTPARVDLTYMYTGGSTGTGEITVPAHGRETVSVNKEIGPDRDVSVQLESDQPVVVERPMYFMYHNSIAGGSVELGSTDSAKTWYLAEGTTRQGFQEWLTIQNPGSTGATVNLTGIFSDGSIQTEAVTVSAHGRKTVLVNDLVGPEKDVSMKLDSEQPFVVERAMYYTYQTDSTGGSVQVMNNDGTKTCHFPRITTGKGSLERLTFRNPNSCDTNATITFRFGDGTTSRKTVTVQAGSEASVSIGQSTGMESVCDGIGINPYSYPENWSWYYDYLKNMCAEKGYPDKEVVVSEIGWPHNDVNDSSPEKQRLAIGDEGLGSLWKAGCRKIWVYKDIDDAPGTCWDDVYCGLFYYDGTAAPAWNEYLRWQSNLANYGNKPGGLW